ncbi:TetR/AcrR family transcriptional regulator [Saccharopolyspora taberi]|uniref:HTH tetR-type domain-containing protein n=1 Tax=Saccharopolyspora taberi TaxID=60895 RepID=A0ABN3VGS8_9PSEU
MARRWDPHRRDRIIDTALECIAEHGVAGTTHRVLAARCDVPLGSMTYHFSGMDELLLEAFGRYAARVRDMVSARLDQELETEAAIEAVVALIHDDFQGDVTGGVISYELYALASRRPEFRPFTHDLIDVGLTALRRHFTEDAARAINTYIEGVSTHLVIDTQPPTVSHTRETIRRLASGSAVVSATSSAQSAVQ